MAPNERRTRLQLAVVYFITAYGVLFWYSSGNAFCFRANGTSHSIVTARLALACTIWDFVASAAVALGMDAIGEHGRFIPVCSAIVTGVGLASMEFWIYRGYGHFLFENTWADVSCFLTEGFGFMFPVVVAPILALATFLREWFIGRRRR